MGCNNFLTEEDDRLMAEHEGKACSRLNPELQAQIEKDMPAVERVMEKFDKELNTTIGEIGADFKEIIEKDFTVEFEPPEEHNDIWQPDEFEKEGFGPIVRGLPEPKGLLGDIKIEKRDSVRDEVKVEEGKIVVERVLGEADLMKGTIKEYEPRKPGEIKEKVSQLQKRIQIDFKDKATPEEKTIIKELGVAKDAEKIEREWIKQGRHIHEIGHHIKDRLSNPVREAKLEKYYQECKKKGEFVSNRARKDRDEFYADNLRMFCTNPDKVKEVHSGMYRFVEKDFTFLQVWKDTEEYYKE